jgi:hypothetical protein
MAKDPNLVLAKYKTGVQNAGQTYREGVQNPRRSWAAGYLASTDRMVAGLQRAIAENRPQQAVQRLGDAGFKERTLAKSDRYAASATRAGEGYGAVVSRVMQAATAGQNAALQIPGTTWENRLQRVRANAEAIAQAWNKPLV